MSEKIKYFHESTKEEIDKFVKDHPNLTIKQMAQYYPQPEWCSYPDAVHPLGCWSLIEHRITDRNYCKSCDLYRKKVQK